jgi:glycosyltransferase involved in cell wall biosynthesis
MAGAVLVLLATYNGERYLREQIDSILAQTDAEVSVLARDDGSTDATLAILEEYAQQQPERFAVADAGPSTGTAKGNFLCLLQFALQTSSHPCLAFADQDDVWLPGKLAVELATMERLEQRWGAATPLLVFSDARVVDAELRVINASLWEQQYADPVWIHRLERILSQNVVAGCTAVINRPLAQMALAMPEDAFMHDWWIALLACAFGAAAFVPAPTVLYRQHNANVVGAERADRRWEWPVWRKHATRREQWEMTGRQAAALLRVHAATLTVRQQDVLRAYLRCEMEPNRLVRVGTWLRYGFFPHGLKPGLARLWYLWDMKAAKRGDRKAARRLPLAK